MTHPHQADVVAGLSVAMLAIPQALAYAQLAGLPAERGLAAAALPSIAAAMFVATPQLQTGPVALTSLLTFGALHGAGLSGSGLVGAATILALIVGVTRLLVGLLRLGSIAWLISEPVLLGFTTGAAVVIIASQSTKLIGSTTPSGSVVDALGQLATPTQWSLSALAFAVVVFVVVVGARRSVPRLPAVLIVVLASTSVSWALNWQGPRVGKVESGLALFSTEVDWGLTTSLLVPGVVIALVGFAEPASVARLLAVQDRRRWNANREFVGQGVANLAAASAGGFPVGGSFSRSMLAHSVGARSAWSGAFAGVAVLAALPMVGLLAPLPTAVLGAIVVAAVWKLIDITAIWQLLHQSRPQALVAIGTAVATVVFAPRVERGIFVGVGLSLAVHLWRELRFDVTAEEVGTLIVVRPVGVLWFVSVPRLQGTLDRVVDGHRSSNESEITQITLDLAGVGRLDYTAAAVLSRWRDELSADGVTLRFTGIRPGAERAAEIHDLGSIVTLEHQREQGIHEYV